MDSLRQADVGIIFNVNAISCLHYNHINGMCDVFLTGRNHAIPVLDQVATLGSRWKRLSFDKPDHDDYMVLEGTPDKLSRKETHITKASRIACIIEGYNPQLTHIFLVGYEPMITIDGSFDSIMKWWWQSCIDRPIEIFIKKPLPI
jgi:hypothetical protein